MGFARIIVQNGKAAASTGSPVKATLAKYRGGPAQLIITVGGEAYRDAKLKGGEMVEVLLGNDTDHGIIRIRPSKDGQVAVIEKTAPKGRSPYQTVRLGHQPAFVNRVEKAQACNWEVLDDGWLEITLPAWAEETHPQKRAKVAAPPSGGTSGSPLPNPLSAGRPCVPAYEPRRPGRPKKNVTAEMMGDPAPGRSAADQIGG